MSMLVRRPDVSVHLAEEHDVPKLVMLLSDCISNMRSIGLDQWDEIYPGEKRVCADVLSKQLYVLLKNDEIVASWALNACQDPEYSEIAWRYPLAKVAVVHRLMVRPSHERHGFASTAMLHRALRLYQRLDYEDVGAVKFRKGLFRCFEKYLLV